MSLKKHVYSVIIISASEKITKSLVELLPEAEYDPVCVAESVNEAKRMLSERSFDMAVINSPLHDDPGLRLAVDICVGKSTVVLLMIKSEIYYEVYEKVFESGVFTLRKPTTAAYLVQAFDWMRAECQRLRGFAQKSHSLEDKMTEIRIVNRAKWALIETMKMTEVEAHRFIEKQAMDRCVPRRVIAEEIIKVYS